MKTVTHSSGGEGEGATVAERLPRWTDGFQIHISESVPSDQVYLMPSNAVQGFVESPRESVRVMRV